jgi:hypothetical protein
MEVKLKGSPSDCGLVLKAVMAQLPVCPVLCYWCDRKGGKATGMLSSISVRSLGARLTKGLVVLGSLCILVWGTGCWHICSVV